MNNSYFFDTVKDFDSHISSSISGYEVLHNTIINISNWYLTENSVVVDLGCSTGLLLKSLSEKYPYKYLIGIDKTESIVEKSNIFEFINADLINCELPSADIVYSIFTLQFIEQKHRKNLLNKIYKSIERGGVFIVSEKCFADTAKCQEIFTFSNYDNKAKYFDSDDILKKERVIRNIMFPFTKTENEKMLKYAGFKIEQFFQSLNFCGWICTK